MVWSEGEAFWGGCGGVEHSGLMVMMYVAVVVVRPNEEKMCKERKAECVWSGEGQDGRKGEVR